jgi:hypothetical protein
MTIAGIDLGSAWLAVVTAEDDLPLRLTEEPRTFAVDPKDLDVVVSVVVELLVKAGVTRAAIEHGNPYAPEGASAAAITAMWAAHTVCTRLDERITAALQREGIEVMTMARRTWSSRVVPHHQGGVSQAKSNEGVRARCADGAWERLHVVEPMKAGAQHQIDAAGVLLGAWLLDQEPRARRYRYRDRRKDKSASRPAEPSPEERAERKAATRRRCWENQHARAQGYKDAGARAAVKATVGCECRAKHVRGCPLFVPKLERSGAIEAAIRNGSYLR